MKKLKKQVVITLLLSMLCGCATKTTEWIGCPMISNDDPHTPSQGWISSVEIGLRSDGVVVWRDRKPAERD